MGPGRGSASGHIVLSILQGIIKIKPRAYNLLFEKFLNKDKVSRLDIDIDIKMIGRWNFLKIE
ncbi:hypothetical protein HYD59_00835 [Mycoplasmopsis bovis]|nr:hypothetical protein HYD59_00835 [Mycoplasmopsis bovis]